MKVLKFGGTSVGTPESLLNVKQIVESIQSPAVVVVSALGGLTDQLISTARKAAGNNEEYRMDMEAIAGRHFNIISLVVDEGKRQQTFTSVSSLLSDLRRVFEGIFLLRHLPAETLDMVVSYGERMSSVIVAAMINGGKRFDSLKFMKTEEWFGKNIADQKLTESLIREHFSESFDKAIVPGFISTDRVSGRITNLGRGGSDFTAALIAAALNAEILEIWTDVDGFMTADPRIIRDAKVVKEMSFVESMELCTFGAKVIYPPTIYPVFHKSIPIRILNTFNPTAPGTLVADFPTCGEFSVSGVSALKNTTLFSLSIQGEKTSSVESRALNSLSRQGIKVYSVKGSEKTAISFAVSADDERNANAIMMSEFAPELAEPATLKINCTTGLSTVALVGSGLKSQPGLSARVRNSLMRGGIHVAAFSDGGSDSTLTFMVAGESADNALKIIHSMFC